MTHDTIAAIRAAAEMMKDACDLVAMPNSDRSVGGVFLRNLRAKASTILRLLDEAEKDTTPVPVIPPTTKNRDGTERPTAIAVDFDGCLAANAWPGIGEPNIQLIEALMVFRRQGGELILWTCREGAELDNAVNWCWGNFGLKFDALNENLPAWKAMFGNDTRKLGADYYIDDKAVCVKACPGCGRRIEGGGQG